MSPAVETSIISNFYPRSPCGERQRNKAAKDCDHHISIHALLAESDQWTAWTVQRLRHFYPRSPCGERPDLAEIAAAQGVFLSTLSLRRATLCRRRAAYPTEFLSTLSLRRATHQTYQLNAKREFLSTLSLRRATLAGPSGPAFLFNFYPRSPCGERQLTV